MKVAETVESKLTSACLRQWNIRMAPQQQKRKQSGLPAGTLNLKSPMADIRQKRSVTDDKMARLLRG